MKQLLKEIRHNPLLWLLVCVPVVFAAAQLKPEAHTLLFVLSVLAIVPLAVHAMGPARRQISRNEPGSRALTARFVRTGCQTACRSEAIL